MEVSFAATPQTVALISCRPLSPTRISHIRREFLGSAHRLRPPGGLNSRRRCKRLSLFHFHSSPRFIVRASLSTQSVLVVVAIVTFSAISVFYLNQYLRKKNAKEVAVPSNLAQPKVRKDALDLSTRSPSEGHQFSPEDIFREEIKEVTTEMEISCHNLQDEESQLQYQDSASVYEETPVSKLGSTLSMLPSVVEDSIISNKNETGVLPHLPVLQESDRIQPVTVATQLAEALLDRHKEVELKPQMKMVDKSHYAAGLNRNAYGLPTKADAGGESSSTIYSDFYTESARADLYTFYDSEKSQTGKVEILNPLGAVSSQVALVNGIRLSSLRSRSISKGQELNMDIPILTKGNLDDNLLLTSYKGPSSKWKGTGEGPKFPRGKERKHLPQENIGKLPQIPHVNGVHGISIDCAPDQYGDYNHLLRRGRVADCVKLLEDMEARDLLNMDKIYHSRFYDKCKSLKAVEEAFRFTKLISNPTLSTFNMLMSVCANSQDSEGAFQVSQLVQEAGLKVDCKLYTTLISTCAKCGKVDRMFEVFHEMVNAGVEPNVHTYGALIDGCARAGQVAKAFGAYGILRSKKVTPDRVVFNALITACGQSGAVDRAFDVLAEMGAEVHPIDPDCVTVGALMKACSNAGQVDRAKEVYKMIDKYNIKGTPEVYTIAVNCCSQNGDWEFALSVYNDMMRKNVIPDEMFISALIDVAGHAGNVDAAFHLLEGARNQGMRLGIMSYSSLMGACSNAKNWEKAVKLYEDMKSINMKPTISTMNALITVLCEGDQLSKAMNIFSDMNTLGLCPNAITYSILLVASEKKDDLEVGTALFSQAQKDGVLPNLAMSRCMIGMCLRRHEKACSFGEPVLSLTPAWPQVENKWSSLALRVYRESIAAGVTPTMGIISRVLGCLRFPYDAPVRTKIIENLGVSADTSKFSNICSLVEGFGEYDPRAISVLEEAASLGVVPFVSLKENPIVVDARKLQVHVAEVYLLTVLRGLKHRLAAGVKLPNVAILLPVEKTEMTSPHGEKTISVTGRISRGVAALLRRMGLPYQGSESFGKIRINGLALRRWLQPKLASPFTGRPGEFGLSQTRLGKGITHQQRNIRTSNLSLD